MPSLSQISDPVELDNLYIEKTVVYVEGKEDVAFFNDLIGPDLADRLEFKAPEEGSGYHEVKKRVGKERPRNKRIYGLLDGEAAVAFGHFEPFLVNDEVVFVLDDLALDGLFFLAEHELENLLLCHVDVAKFVSESVPIGQIGTLPIQDVREALILYAKRFYLLALLKFAARHFHAAGQDCKAVDQRAGQFTSSDSACLVMRGLKTKIVAGGIPWEDFFAILRQFAKSVTDHFEESNLNAADIDRQLLRIADGKSMLNFVRGRYNGTKQWEGQLQGKLKETAYPEQFLEALTRTTGCNDN